MAKFKLLLTEKPVTLNLEGSQFDRFAPFKTWPSSHQFIHWKLFTFVILQLQVWTWYFWQTIGPRDFNGKNIDFLHKL